MLQTKIAKKINTTPIFVFRVIQRHCFRCNRKHVYDLLYSD